MLKTIQCIHVSTISQNTNTVIGKFIGDLCLKSLLKLRLSMELHAVHSNRDPSKGDYVVVSYMYEAVKGCSYIPYQNMLCRKNIRYM